MSAVHLVTILFGVPFMVLVALAAYSICADVKDAASGKLPHNRDRVPFDAAAVLYDEETWRVGHRAGVRWLFLYWVTFAIGVGVLAAIVVFDSPAWYVMWACLGTGVAMLVLTGLLTHIGARAARENINNRSHDDDNGDVNG